MVVKIRSSIKVKHFKDAIELCLKEHVIDEDMSIDMALGLIMRTAFNISKGRHTWEKEEIKPDDVGSTSELGL
jgi:hypothetical protein